ncbi:hypothetical protein [Hydrogenothermus marinus]|uniref:O-antigen ligase-like membrane protein n=1 Tax=Hydrogenothermus marinus TaxID=133270 RepID=A0A3M0BFD7_9AQUI|nr:hypothetical protein [Hydrogenothermus marinus]RMA93315.1 hypothetical protein CLV39_1378 [Hydrogenothermus marinus]
MEKINIVKLLVFLIGVFSLIFIPDFYGIKIVDFFLVLLLSLLFFNLLKSNIRFNVFLLIVYFVIIIFFLITIIGATINTESPIKSILVAIRYSIIVTIIFLLSNQSKQLKSYFRIFMKGFVVSVLINSLWIFADTIYYYTVGGFFSINENLRFLVLGNDHGLTNRLHVSFMNSNIFLLRSAGIGWDPGGIATALVIGFIYVYETSKSKKLLVIIALSIFLTLSTTGIVAFIVYLIFNFLYRKNKVLAMTSISFLFLFVYIISFIVKPSFVNYDDGKYRHLIYISKVFNIVYAKPTEMLFGYGYRGTGTFMNRYSELPKLQNFYFQENQIPESTLANLFLYGGILGALIQVVIFTLLLYYGNRLERSIIIILLFSYLGYTFENFWTIFIVYMLLFIKVRNYITYIHKKGETSC